MKAAGSSGNGRAAAAARVFFLLVVEGGSRFAWWTAGFLLVAGSEGGERVDVDAHFPCFCPEMRSRLQPTLLRRD